MQPIKWCLSKQDSNVDHSSDAKDVQKASYKIVCAVELQSWNDWISIEKRLREHMKVSA